MMECCHAGGPIMADSVAEDLSISAPPKLIFAKVISRQAPGQSQIPTPLTARS